MTNKYLLYLSPSGFHPWAMHIPEGVCRIFMAFQTMKILFFSYENN